jgi:hypothetical protein
MFTFKNDQWTQWRLKQKNEVKKSVQDQDEKVSSIDEKFKKEIEILNIKWKCWEQKAQQIK